MESDKNGYRGYDFKMTALPSSHGYSSTQCEEMWSPVTVDSLSSSEMDPVGKSGRTLAETSSIVYTGYHVSIRTDTPDPSSGFRNAKRPEEVFTPETPGREVDVYGKDTRIHR
ncbi:MAG: hypothetical protein ACP5G0_11945 [Desulfomonilia bacterium]